MDELKNNLANISYQTDLFGGKSPRLSMKDRIGFLPISIWQPNWEIVKKLKLIVGDDGSTRQLVGKEMRLMGSKVGVSIFNPHLAQMILSAYCPAEARVYDPFGGGGTRGFVAAAMGHQYLGIEIRQEEVDRIIAQQRALNLEFGIVCADSTLYEPEVEAFDFSYTCPPYYDLEVYSHQAGDMSNAGSYHEFLAMLRGSLRGTYKALKAGALAVWVVGNFRAKDGTLRHFNGDLITLADSVGFKLHDELIFWGASGAAAQRAGQFEANRKSVRVHEYIVVLRKPVDN